VAFVWNLLVKFKPWFVALLGILIGYYIYIGIKNFIQYAKAQADFVTYTAAAAAALVPFTIALVPIFSALAILAQTQAAVYLANVIQAGTTVVALTAALLAFNAIFRLVKGQPIKGFTLPVLTYPDCTSCDCGTSEVDAENSSSSLGSLLSQFSNQSLYYNKLEEPVKQLGFPSEDVPLVSSSFSYAIGTDSTTNNNNQIYKVMKSNESILSNGYSFYSYSNYIPFGERINNFNLRQKYFSGLNRISVSFDMNSTKHYDNTLVLIYDAPLDPGSLLTFVNPLITKDVNATYTGSTGGYVRGISGTPLNPGVSTYNVEYCDPNNQLSNLSVSYVLSTGSTLNNYKYPSDVE
jgi:hypothetical protein